MQSGLARIIDFSLTLQFLSSSVVEVSCRSILLLLGGQLMFRVTALYSNLGMAFCGHEDLTATILIIAGENKIRSRTEVQIEWIKFRFSKADAFH